MKIFPQLEGWGRGRGGGGSINKTRPRHNLTTQFSQPPGEVDVCEKRSTRTIFILVFRAVTKKFPSSRPQPYNFLLTMRLRGWILIRRAELRYIGVLAAEPRTSRLYRLARCSEKNSISPRKVVNSTLSRKYQKLFAENKHASSKKRFSKIRD